MKSGGGISIWGPTQNALVRDNRILGEGDYAFAAFFSNGNRFINNIVKRFAPTGLGMFDPGGWGIPTVSIPAARGLLYASDSNVVKGVGKPGPLDIVYDCGQNNQITNMIALPCPEAASLPAMPSLSAQAPGWPARNPFWGKWLGWPQK
jgi:hypothetical protein